MWWQTFLVGATFGLAALLKLNFERLFYKPRRNAIPINHVTGFLQAIELKTSDKITLRGFVIGAEGHRAKKVIVYMHGMQFFPNTKIPRLIDFARRVKATVICINYRGYAYSDNAACTEDAI